MPNSRMDLLRKDLGLIKDGDFPECEKLQAHETDWNSIYPFLEWLREQGVWLCRMGRKELGEIEEIGLYPIYYPIGKSITQLLYEYLSINPEKLEEERRELLDHLREQNRKRDEK